MRRETSIELFERLGAAEDLEGAVLDSTLASIQERMRSSLMRLESAPSPDG